MTTRHDTRGQALVEFALVVPILIFLLTGFFDLGRVVLAHDTRGHAAREAARYAIVHGGSVHNTCPAGPLSTKWTTVPAATATCPYPSPSKESIYEEARQQANIAGLDVTVEVCYGQDCTGNTDLAKNDRGTPVTVTLHTTVEMAALSIFGIGSFDVTSSSTMLVNH
jgi:Flp pilus assembly protein TadG